MTRQSEKWLSVVAVLLVAGVIGFFLLNTPDNRGPGERIDDAFQELGDRTPGERVKDAVQDAY